LIGKLKEKVARMLVGSPQKWQQSRVQARAAELAQRKAAMQLPAYMAASSGGFQGGKLDRITEEWNPGTIGPNRAFQMDGKRLRERARDLVLNNPKARAAVDAYVANVLECGITPKPRFDDEERRKLWTSHWDRWGGMSAHATREADVTGKQTLYELNALWLREIIIGGGCLAHYVERPLRGRTLPTAIELIPEERFAEEVQWSGPNTKTANPVINGVEIEESTGRDVAYWVWSVQPNDLQFAFEREPLRLPAEECEYSYFRTQIGQYRGYSMFHAAIVWLWALGYYTDNELKNSDVKSSWAYMILTDLDASGGDWADLMDSSPESGTVDYYGNTVEKLEPQSIWRGQPGDKIQAVGPNVPGSDSLPWIELIDRSIAIGMNLSYEELCRDYSKGSFSSVRASANADRKRYRPMQKFNVNHFSNPTYRRFGAAAARVGLEGFPRPAEYMADLDHWLAVDWRPPGWESVNPKDDAAAEDLKLKNGTTTRSIVIGKTGGDWEEVDEQRQREMESEERRGLPSSTAAAVPAATDPELNEDQAAAVRTALGE